MNMKKMISIILAAVCVCALAGCGGKNDAAAGASGKDAAAADVSVDYGNSTLYTKEDMDSAIALIKKEFGTWEGCELHSIAYSSDDKCTPDNVAWMNELEAANDAKEEFTQCIMFTSSFHSPKEGGGAWEADKEYTDYEWWLGRADGGNWKLMTWGY